MRIMVTGAGGFVGKALVEWLAAQGHAVRAITRQIVPDIATADWAPLLVEIDAVVHLAARVHQLREKSADPLAEFRRINRDATLRLAEAAIAAGNQRFVFISSVKAATESTGLQPIDEDQPANPVDPYGISKLEAEQGLLALAGQGDFEPVILRVPLVYGPGAKGNMRTLFTLVRLGMPLPLGSIDNRRSLIGLGNLVRAIELALITPPSTMSSSAQVEDPGGAGALSPPGWSAVADHDKDGKNMLTGKIFYLEDTTLSTPALLRAIAMALQRPTRLFPVPPKLLELAARLAGQQDKYTRLGGSLAVSSARFRLATGWQPIVPLAVELEKAAQFLYH
jgi:nucleoside-diphosphate-sugar epimerase